MVGAAAGIAASLASGFATIQQGLGALNLLSRVSAIEEASGASADENGVTVCANGVLLVFTGDAYSITDSDDLYYGDCDMTAEYWDGSVMCGAIGMDDGSFVPNEG